MLITMKKRLQMFFIFMTLILLLSSLPVNSIKRNIVVTKKDSIDYLIKYGYLPSSSSSSTKISNDQIREALKNFQHYAALEQTGKLDYATLERMSQPRCGLKDETARDNALNKFARFRYSTFNGWPKQRLTWHIASYSTQMPKRQQQIELQRAFDLWAEATASNAGAGGAGAALLIDYMQPRQQTSSASDASSVDLKVSFVRGQHGDNEPFDGQGGALGHAFFPRFGGATHFDDAEMWTANTTDGVNLYQVAVHEFGHALGLGHSQVQQAVMAPFYKPYAPDFQLHADDVAAIRALYSNNIHDRISTPVFPPDEFSMPIETTMLAPLSPPTAEVGTFGDNTAAAVSIGGSRTRAKDIINFWKKPQHQDGGGGVEFQATGGGDDTLYKVEININEIEAPVFATSGAAAADPQQQQQSTTTTSTEEPVTRTSTTTTTTMSSVSETTTNKTTTTTESSPSEGSTTTMSTTTTDSPASLSSSSSSTTTTTTTLPSLTSSQNRSLPIRPTSAAAAASAAPPATIISTAVTTALSAPPPSIAARSVALGGSNSFLDYVDNPLLPSAAQQQPHHVASFNFGGTGLGGGGGSIYGGGGFGGGGYGGAGNIHGGYDQFAFPSYSYRTTSTTMKPTTTTYGSHGFFPPFFSPFGGGGGYGGGFGGGGGYGGGHGHGGGGYMTTTPRPEHKYVKNECDFRDVDCILSRAYGHFEEAQQTFFNGFYSTSSTTTTAKPQPEVVCDFENINAICSDEWGGFWVFSAKRYFYLNVNFVQLRGGPTTEIDSRLGDGVSACYHKNKYLFFFDLKKSETYFKFDGTDYRHLQLMNGYPRNHADGYPGLFSSSSRIDAVLERHDLTLLFFQSGRLYKYNPFEQPPIDKKRYPVTLKDVSLNFPETVTAALFHLHYGSFVFDDKFVYPVTSYGDLALRYPNRPPLTLEMFFRCDQYSGYYGGHVRSDFG